MFSDKKATAVVGYFLGRAEGHRVNDLKMMKLLYLSERESLRRYTAPITDSALFSMKNGPVLSEVLDLFYGKGESPFWDEHIGFMSAKRGEADENTIFLRSKFEAERFLSRAEVEILEEVWDRHRDDGKWSLVELTHAFPEWDEDAKRFGTAFRLRERKIFEKGFNDSPEIAAGKVEDLEYFRNLPA